ncbi:MAG TPA: hypothetical protein VK206_00330 [Anaerolineales bacterium]|nr:hypothetical protein [Anaerolineales bacterium]
MTLAQQVIHGAGSGIITGLGRQPEDGQHLIAPAAVIFVSGSAFSIFLHSIL